MFGLCQIRSADPRCDPGRIREQPWRWGERLRTSSRRFPSPAQSDLGHRRQGQLPVSRRFLESHTAYWASNLVSRSLPSCRPLARNLFRHFLERRFRLATSTWPATCLNVHLHAVRQSDLSLLQLLVTAKQQRNGRANYRFEFCEFLVNRKQRMVEAL